MSFKPFDGELDAETKFVPFDGELDGEPTEDLSKPFIGYGQSFKAPTPAQKPRESVLEGVQMPEPAFNTAEAGRLSRRDYAEANDPARQQDPAGQEMRATPGGLQAKATGDGMLGRAGDLIAAQTYGAASGLGRMLATGAEAVGAEGLSDTLDAKAKAAAERKRLLGQGVELERAGRAGDQVEGFAPGSIVQDSKRFADEYLPQILAQSPQLPMAMFGGLAPLVGISYLNSYADAREAGRSPTEALAYAVPQASAEYIGERLGGMGKLSQAFEKAMASGFAKDAAWRDLGRAFMAAGAKEVPSEELTYGLQFINDKFSPVGLQPGATWEDFKKGAADTAIVALGSGGMMAGAGALITGRQPPEPRPITAPIAEIAPAQTTDEAIVAAARALDAQPAQAVANIERILGEGNVSTPTAVQPVDSGAAGGGVDLAAPGVAAGAGTDGTALPAVDARGPAAELPAADVPQPAGPDLAALTTENAQLRAAAIRSLEQPPAQAPAAPAQEIAPIPGTEPAAQLPPAGPAALEAPGVAPQPTAAPSARQVALDAERAKIEAQRVKRSTAAREAAKPMEGLSVGSMPTNAEPVTVKDGVVYVGKHPAQNFDTGEDVVVPPDATPGQVVDALKKSGAMGKRAKFFGLPANESPAQTTQKPEPTLASPEQQRADFAAAEKARTAPGNRALARAHDANPFKAFIAKHGISTALANEFAPGKKERQAALVQGYGPVFRKSGLQLDALAELAVQDGYLTAPDVTKLSAMIADALRGKRVIPQYAEGAAETEMETRAALEKEADEAQNAEVEAEAQAEREAIQALAALSDESLLQTDDTQLNPGNNVSKVDFLRALGFSEQEIQDGDDGQDQGQGRARQNAQGAAGPQETPPAQAPAAAGRREGQARADDEGLTAPTRADIEAQQDRAAGADALDQREQVRRESEAGAGLFSLTQEDGRQDTTGSLFDQPVSQLSAPQLLRAAADKMEGKAEKPAAAKPAERPTASWVIREKDTGKVIMETFDKKKVEALNTKKYEAVPIQEHLASLSEKPSKEEPQEPMFSRAPIWRSALQDGIEGINAKALTGAMWADGIKGLINKGAVKADEVEWSGLTDWLKLQTGKVTKQQVLDFLDQNGVQVEEVTLTGDEYALQEDPQVEEKDDGTWAVMDPDTSEQIGGDYATEDDARAAVAEMVRRSDGAAKFRQYTLPGGTNYREVLLTLPVEAKPKDFPAPLKELPADYENVFDSHQPEGRQWSVTPPGQLHARPYAGIRAANAKEAREQALAVLNSDRDNAARDEARKSTYRSDHWDQQNVLAHLRVNDRTDSDGKRVLFVEEIQSDWGQEGKKKGFADNNNPIIEAQRVGAWSPNDPNGPSKYRMTVDGKDAGYVQGRTEQEAIERLQSERRHFDSRVPVAPFVTKTDAWLNLALKRVITMASQEGYDRVAFVNGEQSATRYSLSKRVDSVSWEATRQDGATKNVELRLPNSNPVRLRVDGDGAVLAASGPGFAQFQGKQLDAIIGKNLAKKIMGETTNGSLSGVGLDIGGEGMKAFYDQIVPNAAKALLKKLGGGELQTVEIAQTGEAAESWRKNWPDQPLKTLEQPGFNITPAMREKAAQGLPMFARAEEGQLPAVITPSTVQRVQAAVAELLGGKQLSNSLGRIVATTAAEIKSTWEPLIGKNVQIGSEAEAGVAQAFYDPRTKTVFMIADHINEGAETAVLAHELMHKHGQTVLGEAGWNRLHSLIGTWKDADEDSDERFVYDYATRKVQAVGQELSTQELFPYAVEAAIRMGIKPSLQAKRGTVANWLESVRQSLKSVWGRITGKPETFKAQDLVDLAFGIAQMENPEEADVLRGALDGQAAETAGQEISYSSTESVDMQAEQKALQALSESDDLFALPKSDKTTVAEIAAENDTDIKVRQTKIVNETLYTLTMPSGETAKLWVRPANPYSDQIYSMDLVDGDTSNVETGRPGENPEDVDPNIEDVYLDVSNLKPGQDGNVAYNIAATFAHNTGRIFIGDPSGLSDIAMRRRLENMISTALKFGTTDHIAPHPRQVKGAAGVPPLKWVYGDSLGNIRRMIDASLKAGENSGKPQLTYDTRTGNFSEESARRALDAAGGQMEPVAGPAAGGLPRVQSATEPSRRTEKRAAIFRALLRETSEGRGGAQRGRDGILAGLSRVRDQFPGATKGIFYSRGSASPGQTGVTPPGGTPSATSAAQPNAWDLPPDTRTDRIIYDLQDGRVDLKRVQQAIKDAGNQVDELWDARLAETLYPGRVAHRSKQFLDAEVKPLLQAMALNKVEMDELSDYLHARGAEERNAQIAKVNPDLPDGGAGKNSKGVLMTNQAAKAYLATIGQSRKAVLDALAKRVDAITGGTRKLLVSEGLEKQETIDAWEAAYKNYVPMFRDEAESGAPHPQGMGFAVKGSASRRATGSTKQVTNMLAHVLMQREAAITRAEKNHVAMALYGLALSNPNPEFWTTIRPGMSDAKINAELQGMGVNPAAAMAGMERAPTIRTVDEATGKVVDRPNPMYRNLPGAIPLKVNGDDRVLMLNTGTERGARLAENLKNLDGLTRLDLAGSIVGRATRWLAAVNTQYNPAFGLVNLTRDTLGGAINLGSTELRGKALEVLAKAPAAIGGIAWELMRNNQSGKWGRLYRQFVADGGQTGYKEMWRDPHERARAIEKELKAEGKLTPGKVAHAVLDVLDGFNTTLENAVRLSAYSAALDKGMSRPEAARLGRELTVDFNRKGRAGREIGPLYAFFNASVQGTARTIETIKGPTGAKIIAGGLSLGILQALMLAAAGYDDDEIPEFVKARSLIIPMPGEGKQFISIPYPLGLHVLPNTGRVLAELVLNGGKNIGKRSVEAVGEIAAAFNPLGGGNVLTAHGALTTVAPTLVDPLIDLAANKNFAGNPIERQPYGDESDNRPGAARAKESTQRTTTGQVYIGISEAINRLTGGSSYEAGLASPTPERVRYLAQTVGGGVLRELENGINASTAAGRGEKVKSSQIPVVGRFYGEVDADQVQASRYFENSRTLRKAESSFKAMANAGDAQALEKFVRDRPEFLMAAHMREMQKAISELNKLAVTVIDNPKLMTEIDAARAELMKTANGVVKDMETKTDKERGRGPSLGDRLRAKPRETEPAN